MLQKTLSQLGQTIIQLQEHARTVGIPLSPELKEPLPYDAENLGNAVSLPHFQISPTTNRGSIGQIQETNTNMSEKPRGRANRKE